VAMELKKLCQNYTSFINEKIRNEFEEYFLGSQLACQIRGQIEEVEQNLYYSVIEEIIEKHRDITSEYIERISEIKWDCQAHFTTMYAIKDLFERGILSPREDRDIEMLSGEEDVISYFLAISNYILKRGIDENDLALLDQADFSGCAKDTKGLQALLYKIADRCFSIRDLHSQKRENEKKSKIEDLVNFLAKKNLVRFDGPAKRLKEKLQEVIDITLTSLFEKNIDTLNYAEFLIKQVFGQNLLFEILAFTKFIKFGFPVLPKCKVRKRDEGDVVEFDIVVLIDELEYKPILLVEVTTRGTFKSLKEKIKRIQRACELLKEEFSGETFMPLFIGCEKSIGYVEKIISANDKGECRKSPIPILFSFDDFFFYINSRETFLDELKKRYEPWSA